MKTAIKLLGASALLFCATFANAQQLQDGAWNTYYGKIGNDDAQLSLYKFKDSSVKGNYILKKSGGKITVQGQLKGNALLLNDGKDRIFKGNLFKDTIDKYDGIITNGPGNHNIKFHLSLSTISWGEYSHHYTDVFGTDDEIEQFMEKVKDAIINGDTEWIALHLTYPFRFPPAFKGKPARTKAEFLKRAPAILTSALRNKVRDAYTTNLFVKDGGVMLGDGDVWIANTPNSIGTKYSFTITAIN